jgi:phosphate transport system ATP-binding protein
MGRRIDVHNLNIYYDKFRAVAGVSMQIDPCRITALIGPSGTGKSSVLRALNRLHEVPPLRRVEGQVLLDGQDIYAPDIDVNAVRHTIGMVFQQPNPFPTMSIYQNAVAGLILSDQRVSKRVLDETAESALRRANLWDEVKDRLKAPGTSLSGGQQQRLCIARAIAVGPQVLLLDEPASALDPTSTLAIEDLMLSLKKDITIVIVTHNMEQAARISDRTAFFNLAATGQPGELVEIDDTEKIFTRPSDPRTNDYVSGRFG